MRRKQLAVLLVALTIISLVSGTAWATSHEVLGRGYLGEDPYEVPQTEKPEPTPTPTPGPGTTNPGTTNPGTKGPGGGTTPGISGGSSPRTGDYADLTRQYITLLLSIIVLLALVWVKWHMEDLEKKTVQKS